MAQPGLVDHLGRPFNFSALKEEHGAPSVMGVRSILSGHPADGLTPTRLAGILRQAERGEVEAYFELAEQMEEKYLHYLSVLGTRKRAVAQLNITVEAAGTDALELKIADFVRDWLDRDELELESFDILDAIGKGVSYTNVVWDMTSREWRPKRLIWRDPRWFTPDPVDGSTPLLRTEGNLLAPLEPGAWMVHEHRAKSGLPIRGGLARPVAWAYLFQNFTIKDWVAFAEVYGLPLRLGKYDNGETEDNIRKLMRAVASVSSDAAAVIPKSMDLEFVDGKTGAAGDLFERLANYLDQQVSKAVIGQTATTDAVTGGLGSGKEHGDVRGDIRDADAKLLAGTLNAQLIRLMVDFNFGPQARYPRLRIGVEESVDVTKLSTALGVLVPLGLKVSAAEVRDKLGLEDPGEDEEVLQPPAKAAPAQGAQDAPGADPGAPTPAATPPKPLLGLSKPLKGRSAAAASLTDPAPDAIDLGTDAALANWQPLVDDLVVTVEEALAGATTLQQARDLLAGAVDSMSIEAIAELLARTTFGARLAGVTGQGLEVQP
jgi:phage gp29-like protein